MYEGRGHVCSNVIRRFAQLGTAHADVKDPSVDNLELPEAICVKPEVGQDVLLRLLPGILSLSVPRPLHSL